MTHPAAALALAIADELGAEPATVALAWVRQQPGVVSPMWCETGTPESSIADHTSDMAAPA